jgi:uncharacterized membrane protein
MKAIFERLRAHVHLVVSAMLGVVVGWAGLGIDGLVPRILLGWNVGCWSYLVWTLWAMARANHERVKRVAEAQAESAGVVLLVVVVAAVASLGGAIVELSAAKGAGHGHELPHVLATLATVVGSWLLVPTLFALNYASRFHTADKKDGGLTFPETEEDYEPDYGDFLYFSFTIAVASQTSDVAITTRAVRRLVLLQSVLSFFFNTTILAFTINMAASLL